MKVIFTLGSPAIGGGTNVIFEHASYIKDQGNDVFIVCKNKISKEEYAWHSKAHKLKFVTYEEIKEEEFDVAIATWWETVYNLYKIKAKDYIYFVQSIESKFYKDKQKELRLLSELTYALNLKVITEATWIKKYLEENYDLPVKLVLNGIRKDIFKVLKDVPKHEGLRVLVEGLVDVHFKNVPLTIELAKKSKASEIWLLTSSDIKKYPGVDKVFSKIPPKDCVKVYSQCDVIVKLSLVEGMFGPPLEMFHTGGTAIVYDVSGHDEYIKDKYNGIVVKTGDEEGVIKAINSLTDEKLLNKYKKNALITAANWDSWEESSANFYEAMKEHLESDRVKYKPLVKKTNLYYELYTLYNDKEDHLVTVLGRMIKRRSKFLYKHLKKVRDLFRKEEN